MSDLVSDAKYLRYYYTSEDAAKDKDLLKNETFEKYAERIGFLFAVPLGFQVWQILLVNNFEKAALYNRVRIFKSVSFASALGLGLL